MSVVNTNMSAVKVQQALVVNSRDLASATQQIATGRRINGAADDAAGLAVSNKLSTQAKSLDMAVRNANDGISLLQTADAATSELTNILVRMRELAIQAANDTYSNTDRDALQVENASLQAQVGNILENAKWNGMKILKGEAGTSGAVRFHVGASGTDYVEVSMATLNTGDLLAAQSSTITSLSSATSSIETIDDAISELNVARTRWGAVANRLVHSMDNASNVSLQSKSTVSTVTDADYAKATAELARSMILDQAGSAMLSQANQQPYYVLALLR